MEQWHRIWPELEPEASGDCFRALAPMGSPWYAGHFPGDPILPGIAILAMVKESILAVESRRGRSIRIDGIRRVRFRLPVRPDDRLTLTFTQSGQGKRLLYTFKAILEGKMVCSGIFTAAPLTESQSGSGSG
ncbi:MAG: hypothetical protein JW902_14675 [Syntrophaceae bacterium]|nr:hypothetical protein [Syntrophaceae bacterium]